MSKQTSTYLKNKFITGYKPTQQDFTDLFDSLLSLYGGSVGDGTNQLVIEADGTIRFQGTATVWKDLLPTAVYPPTGTASPNITVYPGATTLKCQEFPAGGADSTIYPHMHMAIPDDGTGGTINFQMIYQWVNHDQVGAVTEVTLNSTTITRTANQGVGHNVVISFPSISGIGKQISSIISCRVIRAAGTFGPSVWLKSADLHVECDAVGSREAFVK
jgi:hypothetical protein